jgi:uncharacterized protein YcnI
MKIPFSGTRRLAVTAAALLGALVWCAAASAHAEMSPPVAVAGHLQLFTLAVPTEEEDAETTTIELTPPSGFGIDSFVPSPGWKRDVASTGSGEDAVVTKVTWSGGNVPTEEDSVFQFLADPANTGTYTFQVRQTYSNGKVVNWSGPESSDTPAPTIEAKSSFGGGGGSSTLEIVALILGALGVVLGGVALFSRRGGRELA